MLSGCELTTQCLVRFPVGAVDLFPKYCGAWLPTLFLHQFGGPPSLLYIRYREFFLRDYADRVVALTTHLFLVWRKLVVPYLHSPL